MAFHSWEEAEKRLENPDPLSSEEIRDLLPYMNQVGETAMRRLTLESLHAVRKFEKSSSKLTKWLIGLTVVLVILTIVIARYTVVLARKETSGGDRQSTSSQSTSAKKMLGPWKAKFSIPGSAEVPEKNPILKYSFAEDANAGFGYVGVTVANLSGNSHAVRYSIYGYDEDGRRISEGTDDFKIGERETVLRKVFLVSQQSVQGQLGSVFWIQVVLED